MVIRVVPAEGSQFTSEPRSYKKQSGSREDQPDYLPQEINKNQGEAAMGKTKALAKDGVT